MDYSIHERATDLFIANNLLDNDASGFCLFSKTGVTGDDRSLEVNVQLGENERSESGQSDAS